MTITKIKKRNKKVVDFDRNRIEIAIEKACTEVGEIDKSFIKPLTDEIIHDLEYSFEDDCNEISPTVEDVQDIIERHLVSANKYEVVKAYILYRAGRGEERAEKEQDLKEQFEQHTLKVIKDDGSRENFNNNKIKKVLDRATIGYKRQCTFKVFTQAFKKNIVEDIKTSDINKLMIKTCIDLVSVENIHWQHVAARIFVSNLYKQATRNRDMSMKELYTPEAYKDLFDEYIENGLYYKDFYKYYSEEDILKAGKLLSENTDKSYEYTTVLSLEKRYLLNPNGVVKELPQELYMSVALFLAIPESDENRLKFAMKLYKHCSEQRISLPTPTLLNARTNYNQLSSCFKANVDDDLRAIFHSFENMAQISKFGGGVGVYWGNIRARGGSIRGVYGASGGVNPWIKIVNDTAIAVNQLGSRLGAISVTLDVWHLDIHDFLDLQTETGDIRSKAFDVFPAVSMPDIFMRRVQNDEEWTLFDPHEINEKYGKKLQDNFGDEFEKFYEELEKDDELKMKKTVSAKDLFKKFMKIAVETGMPYVFFRDTINAVNPNKHAGNIYSSQLCTEICQNTSPTKFIEEVIEDGKIVIRYEPGDFVVCNLASINVAKVYEEKVIADVIPTVMRVLDNVITLNYYPIKEAERTAMRYRSVGLGYLGLAEYLATRKIAYETQEARDEVNKLFEKYTYHTYRASADIAIERGAYQLWEGSEYSKGILLGRKQAWYTKNTGRAAEWKKLFTDIKSTGVRFGYHTAPAPNTSTAGLVGTTAALLPIYKRYFVETNLSAPTVRVAPKLDKENFWYYKEYVSMDMNDVIDMMSVIYQWVDQSVSFEWMIDPSRTSPKKLYEYYMNAWEKKIKTVYYVRSLSGEVQKTDNVCISCSG
ncbi:MAG: ribonucleoside-diphosphate reductase subunit alpha [Candidatus Moraniibacteriota bacterium]|jgi:ribonucleoside-diphosphate reductase alpha chain